MAFALTFCDFCHISLFYKLRYFELINKQQDLGFVSRLILHEITNLFVLFH